MVSWCNRTLTDGFVPEHQLDLLAVEAGIKPASKYIKECVQKLLEMAPKETSPMLYKGEGGYLIHDYLDYQPSKEQVLAHREHIKQIRSENGSKGADARWGPVGPDGKRHGKPDNKTDSKPDGKTWQNDGKSIAPFPESRIRESISESGVVYVDSSSARESSTKTGSGGSKNFLWSAEKMEAIEIVEGIARDYKSRNAFGELYDRCDKNQFGHFWEGGLAELRAHIRSGTLKGPAGAFFYGRVNGLLEDKGLLRPKKVSVAERAEIDAALKEFKSMDRHGGAPDGDERPP